MANEKALATIDQRQELLRSQTLIRRCTTITINFFTIYISILPSLLSSNFALAYFNNAYLYINIFIIPILLLPVFMWATQKLITFVAANVSKILIRRATAEALTTDFQDPSLITIDIQGKIHSLNYVTSMYELPLFTPLQILGHLIFIDWLLAIYHNAMQYQHHRDLTAIYYTISRKILTTAAAYIYPSTGAYLEWANYTKKITSDHETAILLNQLTKKSGTWTVIKNQDWIEKRNSLILKVMCADFTESPSFFLFQKNSKSFSVYTILLCEELEKIGFRTSSADDEHVYVTKPTTQKIDAAQMAQVQSNIKKRIEELESLEKNMANISKEIFPKSDYSAYFSRDKKQDYFYYDKQTKKIQKAFAFKVSQDSQAGKLFVEFLHGIKNLTVYHDPKNNITFIKNIEKTDVKMWRGMAEIFHAQLDEAEKSSSAKTITSPSSSAAEPIIDSAAAPKQENSDNNLLAQELGTLMKWYFGSVPATKASKLPKAEEKNLVRITIDNKIFTVKSKYLPRLNAGRKNESQTMFAFFDRKADAIAKLNAKDTIAYRRAKVIALKGATTTNGNGLTRINPNDKNFPAVHNGTSFWKIRLVGEDSRIFGAVKTATIKFPDKAEITAEIIHLEQCNRHAHQL